MKLLAIETSGQACSVALMVDDQITSRFEFAPMRQAQIILPMIEQILADSSTSLKDLDALCFGCGPGSFTGVRLATSVVQGIGFANNIPVIPISSLATLAQTAYQQHSWDKLLVAVDARMQEVYWAHYEVNNELVSLIGKEIVSSPERLPLPTDQHWFGIGNGWETYRPQMSFNPVEIDSSLLPLAEHLLLLAKPKFIDKQVLNARDVVPTYVRDKVANKS